MSNTNYGIKDSSFSSRIKKDSFFEVQDKNSYLEITSTLNKEINEVDDDTTSKDALTVSSKSDLIYSSEAEPALANWNKWLKVHETQQNKLSSQLQRPPQCLVMNTNLNSLYVNQEKDVITEAFNYNFSDKYRGHPNFWKTGDNFKNNGKSLGVYQPIQHKYDRSGLNLKHGHCQILGKREYVEIPDAIIKEKKLDGKPCLPTSKIKWENSEYVNKKRELLKEKLEVVQKHKPDASDLAIVGIPIIKTLNDNSSTGTHLEKNNSLEAAETTTEMFSPQFLFEDTQRPILVSIGEKEINENIETWTVCFENCIVDQNYNISVYIKNLKHSTLRYSWALELPNWVNSDWPLKYMNSNNKCFHFDKNNSVILPGCEGKIVVYFQSPKAGVFSEYWTLSMSHKPDVWSFKKVHLLAVAVEKQNSTKNIETIDSYIESCTRYTIARKAVEEILDRRATLRRREELPYDWKFFEEQIFVYNNPDLFYDNKCVHILKQLHSQISDGPWDYSVDSLRSELLKKSLDKPLGDELQVYTSTLLKLMKPNLSVCLLNEKRKSVFELLSCFVSKIELESTNLKFAHKIPVRINSCNGSYVGLNTKSSKLKATPDKLSKTFSKVSNKKNSSKTNSTIGKQSDFTDQNFPDTDLVRKTLSCCETALNFKIGEVERKKRHQEYLDAMYIKTYHHLSQTVDKISAVIDSYNMQRKKTILNALKEYNA